MRVFNKGLLTQNATWCQNRGCICISSVRRTYGRIHIPATIILWSELFPKKRREKIQGEILQSIFEYSGVSTNTHFYKKYSNSTRITRFLRIQCIPTRTTRTTVFLHAIQQVSSHPVQRNYSTYRINSSPRTTRLIPCHPVHTRHLPATAPHASKHSTRQNPAIRLLQHSRAIQHKQASSNSRWQKQHSTRQPASTQSLQ